MPVITFVCWGNICRSAMAEKIARQWFDRAGIECRVDSAGVSSEEEGHQMDRRARKVLADHGYRASDHRAKKITAELIERSDLVIAFEKLHLRHLQRIKSADHYRLVSDFIDSGRYGEDIADPWYGDIDDFEITLEAIEEAMPAIVEHVKAHGCACGSC